MQSNRTSNRANLFSFRLGTLFLATALVAVCIAWWVDRNKPGKKPYDVEGPLTIKYEFQRNERSTPSRTLNGVLGLRFEPSVIVLDTANCGVVIPTDNLIEFDWIVE